MLIEVMASLLAANPTVAAPGFQCSGLDPTLCDAYLEHFVGRVTDRGLKVTTKNDLAELLGLERQRQLLGCADQGSCVAELVGALGVGRLLSGSVARTESGFLATLKVIDVTNGATLWSATEPLESERALFQFFDRCAESLVERITPRSGRAPIGRWIPAMVGAAAVLAGVIAFGLSEADAGRLREYSRAPERSTWTLQDIRATAAAGRLGQIVGVSGFIIGGLSGAASLLWVLLAPSAPAAAIVLPTASGATVSVSWGLP